MAIRPDGPYLEIPVLVDPGHTSLQVEGLPAGPLYYWAVVAVNAQGSAHASPGLHAVTFPNRPGRSDPPYLAALLRTIVLDPGHGGTDPGAIGIPGSFGATPTYESNLALDLAGRVQQRILARSNHFCRVLLTRFADVDVSTGARPAFSRQRRARRFLSIHFNDGGSAQPHQMMALIYRRDYPLEYHPDDDESGQQIFDRNFDQYNQPDDLDFGEGIVTASLYGYNESIGTDPPAELLTGKGPRDGVWSEYTHYDPSDIDSPDHPEAPNGDDYNYWHNPARGHWGVLRDSALWRDDSTVARYPACILEVMFIRNPTFHAHWIENLSYAIRNNVAQRIADQIVTGLNDEDPFRPLP